MIVHLAAVHRDDVRDPQDYQHTNVDGTANIAQVCAEKNIRKIIFTSTVAVYGFAEAGADDNYVDTPDMDMNTLVRQVRHQLTGQEGAGLRMPYWLGMMLGYMADGWAKLSGKTLPVSSIRIKKFCSTTAFATSKSDLDGFTPPYELEDGIKRTIDCEFINLDPDREMFYNEGLLPSPINYF